jgi:hypothetical protein
MLVREPGAGLTLSHGWSNNPTSGSFVSLEVTGGSWSRGRGTRLGRGPGSGRDGSGGGGG